VVGVLVGMPDGAARAGERLLLPVVSVGNPIPGLAYAPLFVIWFGLGNSRRVLLVAFAAAFPIAVNTWSGRSERQEIWIRSAESDGAHERQLFRSVVLRPRFPTFSPGFAWPGRAWRVWAVEMLTAVRASAWAGSSSARASPEHRHDAGRPGMIGHRRAALERSCSRGWTVHGVAGHDAR